MIICNNSINYLSNFTKSPFSYAGLHSKIISGYAKGADYRPGQKFQPGSNQHSWNAVYIYGTWCLIDAHWAARRIIGKQASTEEFHYQLDEYFFLTEPAQLIFTHFPDDQKWQLLERQVGFSIHRSFQDDKLNVLVLNQFGIKYSIIICLLWQQINSIYLTFLSIGDFISR